MAEDVCPELARLLNRLMLPANRGALCAPVIAVAPAGVDTQTYPVLNTLASVGPVTVGPLGRAGGGGGHRPLRPQPVRRPAAGRRADQANHRSARPAGDPAVAHAQGHP